MNGWEDVGVFKTLLRFSPVGHLAIALFVKASELVFPSRMNSYFEVAAFWSHARSALGRSATPKMQGARIGASSCSELNVALRSSGSAVLDSSEAARISSVGAIA